MSQDVKFESARKYAAWVSLVVGVALFAAKFFAFQITGSQGALSDAVESVVNIVAATVVLVVVRMSTLPADKDHPYGHGKVEYFASAFEGGAIAFAGILIVFEALEKFWGDFQLQELNTGLIIIFITAIVNTLLGIYLINRGKKFHSMALEGSGKHVIADSVTSIAVIVGLLLVKFTGFALFDPIIALLVGLNLIWSGFKLLIKSGSELMDAEDIALIRELGGLFEKHSFGGIIRVHHTRVMRSGPYHHVDLHLVVPEFWSVEKAHDESNRFENLVLADYSARGELHFHLDPCRRAYCEVCDLENCDVREKEFKDRIPFSVKELTDPDEPEDFK
jgi:cation diffusion facilitator family transporter